MRWMSLTVMSWISLAHAQEHVIIANGFDLDPLQAEELSQDAVVVALDGVYETLKDWDIKPTYLLGDFDSVSLKLREEAENSGVVLISAPDQNHTDLEKAIIFCDSKKATGITIVGAQGGRMDHSLHNWFLLKKHHKTDRPLYLVSGKQRVSFHKKGSMVLRGRPGEACGFFGFPEGRVTSKGLTYEVTDYRVMLSQRASVSNSLKKPEATLDIKGEILVVEPIS